jgi:hypothetical protein
MSASPTSARLTTPLFSGVHGFTPKFRQRLTFESKDVPDEVVIILERRERDAKDVSYENLGGKEGVGAIRLSGTTLRRVTPDQVCSKGPSRELFENSALIRRFASV